MELLRLQHTATRERQTLLVHTTLTTTEPTATLPTLNIAKPERRLAHLHLQPRPHHIYRHPIERVAAIPDTEVLC